MAQIPELALPQYGKYRVAITVDGEEVGGAPLLVSRPDQRQPWPASEPWSKS